MIEIIELNSSEPYKLFKEYYDHASSLDQKKIEALAISSFNSSTSEVESRFVNLKYIINDEWIFFTNYNSPKSYDFQSHNQISALFYWEKPDYQIRMKANIFKTADEISDNHYMKRSFKKNVLAHASNQSKKIKSYEDLKNKYTKMGTKKSLIENRPNFWGGYSFKPYYFEFWKGHNDRVNQRTVYVKDNNFWTKYNLQP